MAPCTIKCCPGCGQAINFRSSVQPNLRELQKWRPYFVRIGFARPFDALFGHCAVLRGRFHGNAHFPATRLFLPIGIQHLPGLWVDPVRAHTRRADHNTHSICLVAGRIVSNPAFNNQARTRAAEVKCRHAETLRASSDAALA
jgi:hypothetical protein